MEKRLIFITFRYICYFLLFEQDIIETPNHHLHQYALRSHLVTIAIETKVTINIKYLKVAWALLYLIMHILFFLEAQLLCI